MGHVAVEVVGLEDGALHRSRRHGGEPGDEGDRRLGALRGDLYPPGIGPRRIVPDEVETEHVDVEVPGAVLVADRKREQLDVGDRHGGTKGKRLLTRQAPSEEVLDSVYPTGAVLVGNSIGGNIPARLAITRPDLVKALMITDSTSFERPLRLPGRAFCSLMSSPRFVRGIYRSAPIAPWSPLPVTPTTWPRRSPLEAEEPNSRS